jgi:putative FmdB family regulatory protein
MVGKAQLIESSDCMPVYEFVCTDCDTRFDTLVRSVNATTEVICRGCESENVRRVVSTFAVSGFDDPMAARASASSGGGCCGGSCGCGH